MNIENLDSVLQMMLALCIHSLREKVRLSRDPRLGTEDPILIDPLELYHAFTEEYGEVLQQNGISYQFRVIHGEQRHLPRLRSGYWSCQHSWLRIQCNETVYYVDPNIQACQWLYAEKLPDVYISRKKPKWFYAEQDNLGNKIPLKYLRRYKISPHPLDPDSEEAKITLTEYLQYFVWGGISDLLHRIFYTKRK